MNLLDHHPAILKSQVCRSPASLGGYHYYLPPGKAVRVTHVVGETAHCYCGEPEDRRISEDYFAVRLENLELAPLSNDMIDQVFSAYRKVRELTTFPAVSIASVFAATDAPPRWKTSPAF